MTPSDSRKMNGVPINNFEIIEQMKEYKIASFPDIQSDDYFSKLFDFAPHVDTENRSKDVCTSGSDCISASDSRCDNLNSSSQSGAIATIDALYDTNWFNNWVEEDFSDELSDVEQLHISGSLYETESNATSMTSMNERAHFDASPSFPEIEHQRTEIICRGSPVNHQSTREKMVFNSPQRREEVSPSKKGLRSSSLSLQDIEKHYSKSLVDTSRALGISVTMLKKACRRFGIRRWPHRKLASIERMLDQMRSSLTNLGRRTVVQQQDPIILKALQERISILESKKEALCRATSRGMYPGKSENSKNKVYNETGENDDEFDCAANYEIDSSLKDFSISMEREKNQELIALVNTYQPLNSPNNIAWQPADKRSKLILPGVNVSDHPMELTRRNSRHDFLQSHLDAVSPREQLMRLHSHAIQMLNRSTDFIISDESKFHNDCPASKANVP